MMENCGKICLQGFSVMCTFDYCLLVMLDSTWRQVPSGNEWHQVPGTQGNSYNQVTGGVR